MAVALIIAGFQFFSAHRQPGTVVAWRLPWCADVLAATLTFLFDPILSFMEGCGFVANVARLRLQQAAAGSLLAWLALSTHHGLFAPAMMIFGTASTSFFWLLRRWKLLFGLWRHDPGKHHVLWGKEVWPFQWRIAVSWLSGYFIFQLFNPILFAFRGAAVAGQMGMSLNVVNALQAVAISWISTKSAPFGGMIARRDFAQLDKVFFRALIQAMCVFMAGGVLAWSIVVYLNMKHPGLAHRLLSPTLIAIMLLTTAMNVVVTAEATYLRAHKQEKFLINSVLGAIFVGSAAYFLGRSYGAAGIVMGNLVIAILLGLGGGTYVFWKYRRLWHADTPTQYGR